LKSKHAKSALGKRLRADDEPNGDQVDGQTAPADGEELKKKKRKKGPKGPNPLSVMKPKRRRDEEDRPGSQSDNPNEQSTGDIDQTSAKKKRKRKSSKRSDAQDSTAGND
jgi:U3 small nucleolar RNA-associated protein 23